MGETIHSFSMEAIAKWLKLKNLKDDDFDYSVFSTYMINEKFVLPKLNFVKKSFKWFLKYFLKKLFKVAFSKSTFNNYYKQFILFLSITLNY